MADSKLYSFHSEIPPDVIEGIAREGQLITIAGSFSVGKSPLLQELAMCVIKGVPFCGRKTTPRPVIYFDLENAGYSFEQNTRNMCDRHGLDYPDIPDDLEPYILHGGAHSDSGSEKLLQLLKLKEPKDCILFLTEALSRKPNAVVIIDPSEMFFKIDTIRKVPVLELYGDLREILARYPQSLIAQSFNLRKADRASKKPDLLNNPRSWMEEVCGSLDLINRSDVRIGMDFMEGEEDFRVINGVRRGEPFDPIVIKPIGEAGCLAGFDLCTTIETDLLVSFTLKQKQYWDALPSAFPFDDIADHLVPRSSLSRLLTKAKSLGVVFERDGIWYKQEGARVKRLGLIPA